jgi:hypothetical protein
MSQNINRKEQLISKVTDYLDDCCFDIQGLSASSALGSVTETQLARILTKIAIGSATVWWSVLELKDFIKIHNKMKD